jgi:hypothetical protein
MSTLPRKYHTLFNWDSVNANQFFKLFGDEFLKIMKSNIEDSMIKESITNFLFIGSERNKLVHNNFSNYPLDSTISDIWVKFTSALTAPQKVIQS